MKKILILYRELAGYFVECVNRLCEQYDVQVDVIAYPVNSDAPFKLDFAPGIAVYERKAMDHEKISLLIAQNNYSLIFCGGWSDPDYLRAIKHKQDISLLAFDTQWQGSLKHWLYAVYGKIMIRPKFRFAFVPGEKQFQLARHLGFPASSIIRGVYSCDVEKFAPLHTLRKFRPAGKNRKLVFTGRYATEKFIQPLCSAMLELRMEGFSDWELHCIGTGPLWDSRISGEGIIHHGFMQPAELFEFMKGGDAFILPSTFEPWGVVVHEFAAAGYPLILSDNIGASEVFLENEKNGFAFRSGDISDLKSKMQQLFSLDDAALRSMGEKSSVLSNQITQSIWAQRLYDII